VSHQPLSLALAIIRDRKGPYAGLFYPGSSEQAHAVISQQGKANRSD